MMPSAASQPQQLFLVIALPFKSISIGVLEVGIVAFRHLRFQMLLLDISFIFIAE